MMYCIMIDGVNCMGQKLDEDVKRAVMEAVDPFKEMVGRCPICGTALVVNMRFSGGPYEKLCSKCGYHVPFKGDFK